MDMSAVLAYKSLFLANRAKGTFNQASEGKGCTAVANGARVAVTASQTVVPLVAVSNCLARTATNKTIQNAATTIANSKLQNLASVITSNTTPNAVGTFANTTKFLTKLQQNVWMQKKKIKLKYS